MKKYPDAAFLSLQELSGKYGIAEEQIRQFMEFGLFPAQQLQRAEAIPEAEVHYLLLLNRLAEDLEVNLPGIEVILHMRQRLENLQSEVDFLKTQLRQLEHQHTHIWGGP